jgi:hypothetical protein
VNKKFGVMLELEVKTLGFNSGTFDVWTKIRKKLYH